MSLAEELEKQLDINTVFQIGSIRITEGVFVTWIIMAALLVICLFLTRGFTTRNCSRRQIAVETFVLWLEKMIGGMLGEEALEYRTWLCTVIIYIGVANMSGLFGAKPPTRDMNMTIALAVTSIVLVQIAGIRKKGGLGWMKSFAQPVAVVAPLNVLELFIKPLSLCMRLFGNVLGAFVIMELIKFVLPVGLPVVFSAYFDIFDGLLQAYVFVFLTALYIQEAVE